MVNNGPQKTHCHEVLFFGIQTRHEAISSYFRIVFGAARFEWTKKTSIRVENNFTEVHDTRRYMFGFAKGEYEDNFVNHCARL